jgi:phosphatidylglycerophosphate synthase
VADVDDGFWPAVRLHTSLLARAEKAGLIWMAQRLPAAVGSDHLTALGAVAMLLAGAAYWWARAVPEALLLVNVCLAVNWFGDSLDGTLARVRGHERPRYGFYVDHILDGLGSTCLMGGFALSGLMSPGVAAVLLIAYLLVSLEVYLATYCVGTFRISFWKVGPTELRLILMAGNVAALIHPTSTILGRTYPLFDVGGAVAAAGLVVTLAVSVVRNVATLYRREPLPVTRSEAPRWGPAVRRARPATGR